MQKLIKATFLTILISVLFFSCINSSVFAGQSSYEKGMEDAKQDINRGKLKIYAIGRAPEWRKTYYDQILRRKYGIEMIRKDKVDSREEKRYVDGYNAVSVKVVVDRYGSEIFAETNSEAMEKLRENQDE